MFVDQYTEAQRLERVGPVVGTLVIVRPYHALSERHLLNSVERTLTMSTGTLSSSLQAKTDRAGTDGIYAVHL